MQQVRTKTDSFIIRDILAEIRLLRNEISIALPQEDLKPYAHPKKIRQAYQKAQKLYPAE